MAGKKVVQQRAKLKVVEVSFAKGKVKEAGVQLTGTWNQQINLLAK